MESVVGRQGSNAVSTNGFSDAARGLHDGVCGFLRGTAVTIANSVEPYVKPYETKGRELYAENFRLINAGGVLVGVVSFYCAPWTVGVMGVGAVGVRVIGSLMKQPCDTAQAEPHTTSDLQEVVVGSVSQPVTIPAAGSSIAFSVRGSLPSDSSNLPVTVRDTFSKRGSEQIATKMMEGVGGLLKKNLDLVGAADDLAEEHSIKLVNSLYNDGKRVATAETKAGQIAQARKALKASFFVTLLRLQPSDPNIVDTVYRDFLGVERGAPFSRICDSQNVDYEKLAKHFLTYAKDPVIGSGLLKTPETQAFLLNLFTRGWDVSGLQGNVTQENLEALLIRDCQLVRKALIQKAARIGTDSPCASLSAPVADGSSSNNLRQRTHNRQSSTS